MKKLISTLLVAIFTMTSMVFAQLIGGSDGPSFIIKNKTTNETKTIAANKFSSTGSNSSEYDVDFCLGVYNDDQIEVTYSSPTPEFTPQLAWFYSWDGNSSSSLGTALTANLTVYGFTVNGKTLTITCNYKASTTSSNLKTYNINFKNVHNKERIAVTRIGDKEIQVFYTDYGDDDVFSCSGQLPTTALYDSNGTLISKGYLNGLGMGTLATKGNTGMLIVEVKILNATFTKKIQVN